MKHRILAFVVLLVLALTAAAPAGAAPAAPAGPAPLLGLDNPAAIPGRYIVVFKAGASAAAADQALAGLAHVPGANVQYRYTAALHGFAGSLPQQAVDALRRNPNVEYIEADGVMSIDTTQSGATWGLDRIDQTNLPLNGNYNYTNTGAGVTAYIIDTGILTSHTDFGGRASVGTDTVGDRRNGIDCNGHGTHVAGTVGGAKYGVAKGVSLVAVRVLNCRGSGTTSGVVAGVDWVTSNHANPAVANMSLGGGISPSLDTAVSNSIKAGVTYAIAAGNSGANACNYSPARVSTAITVGATDSTDTRASWSNYGSCLDIFAPGVSITSDWIGKNNTSTNTISGTSMATPHVTGVAALYLQGHPSANPSTVSNALTTGATSGKVINPSGSPNLLLYSLIP